LLFVFVAIEHLACVGCVVTSMSEEYQFCESNHGSKLRLLEQGMVARRVELFYHSTAFIQTPLVPTVLRLGTEIVTGYAITVSILEHESWAGGLKLGFSRSDPSRVRLDTTQIYTFANTLVASFDRAHVRVFESATSDEGAESICSGALGKEHNVNDVISFVISEEEDKFFIDFNGKIVVQDKVRPVWREYMAKQGPIWGLVEVWCSSVTAIHQSNHTQARTDLDALLSTAIKVYGQVKALRLHPMGPPALWTPHTHHRSLTAVQSAIETLLYLALPDAEGYARFGGSYFYLLPKELMFVIFQHLDAEWNKLKMQKNK
jgi:hypothetical protein